MNKSYKVITHGDEALRKVLQGINTVANAVKVTLGPGGNLVMYMRYGSVTVTKDGVTVAKEIDALRDTEMSIGCDLAKKVASDTVDACGDGTTTATVLFQAICNSAATYSMSGMNTNEIKYGMDAALKDTIEFLKKEAIKVEVEDAMLEDVATISANGDRLIGSQISQMMKKIGPNGVIHVEKGKSVNTEFEYVEGMKFDAGWVSPYFINNQYKKSSELENPYIIVSDDPFDSQAHAKKLYELLDGKIGQSPLIIICPSCEGASFQLLLQNFLLGKIKVCPVKAPRDRDILSDIAAFVGATKLTSTTGMTVDKLEMRHIGRADKMIIEENNSVIINGKGDKATVQEILDALRYQIDENIRNKKPQHVIESLEKRYSSLGGIVCNYKIGGRTEIEQNELKDRVDDAVRAVKSALEAGIIPGGASCYVRAHKLLSKKIAEFKENSIAFISGYTAVMESLLAPITQALENAGMKNCSQLIIKQILEGGAKAGFDIRNKKMESDMIAAGVCDPAKCAISALEFAVTHSESLINSKCLITTHVEKENNKSNEMEEMY